MTAEPNLTPDPDAAILEAILTIAREREALLAALRSALEARDVTTVQKLARRLCGLTEE
jgi:hypothetical protein